MKKACTWKSRLLAVCIGGWSFVNVKKYLHHGFISRNHTGSNAQRCSLSDFKMKRLSNLRHKKLHRRMRLTKVLNFWGCPLNWFSLMNISNINHQDEANLKKPAHRLFSAALFQSPHCRRTLIGPGPTFKKHSTWKTTIIVKNTAGKQSVNYQSCPSIDRLYWYVFLQIENLPPKDNWQSLW